MSVNVTENSSVEWNMVGEQGNSKCVTSTTRGSGRILCGSLELDSESARMLATILQTAADVADDENSAFELEAE